MDGLFEYIYLFHMPLFVFVSGFFAKSIIKNGRLRVEKIFSIVMLAMLFQLSLIAIQQHDEPLSTTLLTFEAAPWYLISLTYWYLLTPLFSQMRPSAAILISVIAALGINCFEPVGDFLAISRTVVFMPFFLLGYYCTKQNFLRIKNAKWLPAAGIASIVVLVLWMLLGDPLASYNYISHGDTAYRGPSIEGMGMRVVTYALAIVISLGVIFITPRRKTFLATVGERTLQIYILHRLIRPFISEFGFFDMPVLSEPALGILIIFVVSIAITLICSIRIIKKPFDLILNAKWEFLRPKRQDA